MIKHIFVVALTVLFFSLIASEPAYMAPLRWAPPDLEDPITINLTTGYDSHDLDPDQDYIINYPLTRKNARAQLFGGRNIVIIGGHTTVASPSPNTSSLLIGDVTGTVHIEGLLFDNPDLNYFDAIAIQDSPNAIVQIQNVRIQDIHGRVSGVHGDMIQVYSGDGTGLGELRVDRLTGTSDYQGFYLPDFPPIGNIRMQNVNVSYSAPAVEGFVTYLLWLTGPSTTGCDHNPTQFENFYVQPRSGQTFEGDTVFPNDAVPTDCPGVLSDNTLSWPDLPSITGHVTSGQPTQDFVPVGTAGLSYVSPGYDTTPPVISAIQATSAVPGTAATVDWTTDENASTKIDYGLTASYGSATAETNVSTGVTDHSQDLSGLLPCVTYHYRVRSKDIVLRESISSDQTVTTAGCTGSASVEDQNQATVIAALGGSANLLSGGNGIALTIPAAAFGATSAQFQLKQLDKTSLLTDATPPATYTGIGSYFYNVQALSGVGTGITSFLQPITVTFTYQDADVVGIDESTLQLYRYDGSTWSTLSDCNLNTIANTISCTTTQFSDFGLFGKTQPAPQQNATSGSSSSGSSSTHTPHCSDRAPSYAPDLFQINVSNTKATLYFAPGGDPVTYYYIGYGNGKETEQYGVQFDRNPENGVMAYTVNMLEPGKEYSFKVRGGNGCMPGNWSNVLTAKTRKTKSAFQPVEDIYYRFLAQIRYGVRVIQGNVK